MVLDTFLLNTQHYKVWIKGEWSNPGKGTVPSLIPRYCRYWKRSVRVALTKYNTIVVICTKGTWYSFTPSQSQFFFVIRQNIFLKNEDILMFVLCFFYCYFHFQHYCYELNEQNRNSLEKKSYLHFSLFFILIAFLWKVSKKKKKARNNKNICVC